MVKIAVEGIKITGYHGVYPEERKKGTLFVVDVYMETTADKAGQSDDLSHTIDYQLIYELVLDVMQRQVSLLETLAYQMAQKILEEHEFVYFVKVRVSKMKPLLMELCDRTFVEIDLQRR